MIFAVSADHLKAQRKALVAEAGRQRQRGDAEQRPGRAIFGVAGVAETLGRLAEGRQRQDGVET